PPVLIHKHQIDALRFRMELLFKRDKISPANGKTFSRRHIQNTTLFVIVEHRVTMLFRPFLDFRSRLLEHQRHRRIQPNAESYSPKRVVAKLRLGVSAARAMPEIRREKTR